MTLEHVVHAFSFIARPAKGARADSQQLAHIEQTRRLACIFDMFVTIQSIRTGTRESRSVCLLLPSHMVSYRWCYLCINAVPTTADMLFVLQVVFSEFFLSSATACLRLRDSSSSFVVHCSGQCI